MGITIHEIRWERALLHVEYTVEDAEALCPFSPETSQEIKFEEEREGSLVHAVVNVATGPGRQPLAAGKWLFALRIPDAELADYETLVQNRPWLLSRTEGYVRKNLVPPTKRRDTKFIAAYMEREAKNIILSQPYDAHGISLDDAVIEDASRYDRIFPYTGIYAYAAYITPRTLPDDSVYLVLTTTYYQRNDHPEVRKGSIRFKEKQAFNAYFKAASAKARRNGHRILFYKQNGDAPTENMQAVVYRLRERGLDKDYEIKIHCHNVFKSRQSFSEWIEDLNLIAKTDYIFIDDYTPIFGFIDLDKDVVLTQLWHAGVGFKSVGFARFGIPGSPDPLNSCHRAYTYALVGNALLRDTYSEVFGIEKEALLATGMPRLDGFFNEERAAAIQEKLRSAYPWMREGRVIIFAPTFRGATQDLAYYPYAKFLDMERIHEMCVRTNSYFAFEMHGFIKELPEIPEQFQDRLIDLSHEDLNELYHVADVLVTDYSSCFYDYLLLEKPVVFYVPDKVEYGAVRGVQRSVDELAPGTVCDTFDEFMNVLETSSYEDVEPDPSCLDRALEKSGRACDRVIDTILLGQDIPGVRLEPTGN